MSTTSEQPGGVLTTSFSDNPIPVGYASEEIGGAMTVNCSVMRKNKTMSFTKTSYSGIPENVCLNLIVWIVLMLLFIIIRLFWIHKDERIKKNKSCSDTMKDAFGWIVTLFKLSDRSINQKCGNDALIYLMFQRFIIFYMACATVLSIIIVLPVNYRGKLVTHFGQTTIANVQGDSEHLWIHALLSAIYLVGAILLMRVFKNRYLMSTGRHETCRTLMVCNIPSHQIIPDQVQEYFSDSLPGVTVESMHYAYDVKELMKLSLRRQYIRSLKTEAEQRLETHGSDEQIYLCPSRFCVCNPCICLCRCKRIQALEYYTSEESDISQQYEKQLDKVLKEPLAISFLTFEHEGMAIRVHSAFNTLFSCRCYFPHCFTSGLNENRWMVRFAPAPEDLYWENLSGNQLWWWIKAMLLNISIFILVFIFTTPSVIINTLNEWGYQKQLEEKSPLSPFIVSVLPVLLLVLFSALLPVLVGILEVCVGHWTRSVEQKWVMMKVFVLLLLMVLVLPSVGLTSAQALLTWLMTREFASTSTSEDKLDEGGMRWECIFLPDNGAFFVNYVISASMIGTMMILLRLPQLIIFLLRYICAKSAAERAVLKRGDPAPVPYGTMYAWIGTVFCVCVSYSIICPLITPVGLFYFLMRHLADRHHLYYVFKPTSLGPEPHNNAIGFIHVGVMLLQIFMAVFMSIRAQRVPGASMFCLITLVLAAIYLFSQTMYSVIKDLRRKMRRSKAYKTDLTQAMQTERMAHKQMMNQYNQYPYVPEELREDLGANRIFKSPTSGVIIT